MIDIITYYWPRFIVSLLFALYSMYIIKDRYSIQQQLIRGVAFFLLSCPIISIISELINYHTFSTQIQPYINFSESVTTGIFVIYCIFIDVVSFIIPIILYSKLIHENPVIAATMYVQYVLQDRFALLISQDAKGYLIVYFVSMVFLAFVHGSDVEYISKHISSLNWKPVLYYNIALFILIDSCYAAYFFFDELNFDIVNANVIWLDCVVFISCVFAAGFSKLNVHLSKERDKKIDYMQKFQDNQTDIIRDFASISEAKSGETGQHVRRVSEYTAVLASHFFDNETDINYIKVASMMHDIGKLMIPNEIIEKKGKLTPEEYEVIKTHSKYGDALLSHNESEIMTIARIIAYEHHERWDGKGYPRGLRGKETSLYSQIVSVADVYDALTSKRSYKDPWPPEKARQEILDQRGYQFSPMVVDAFEKSYDKIEEIRMKYAD